MNSSDITAIDNFCGAGGSTCGLKAAGVRVVHAANHWEKAIASHNANHPEVDHSCVDLHLEHPSRFPHTTIAWFSPECTCHSPSGGRKRLSPGQLNLLESGKPDPAVERSRMTAWQVVQFTEFHRYEAVLVENVVEFTQWELFDVWLSAMDTLGYRHQEVYFNSQFSYPNPVPQSRDRAYIVFHKKGNRAPKLTFCPPARCHEHGDIAAVQAWKNPLKKRGKYGPRNQYIYVCPHCAAPVTPNHGAARDGIDWSLPMVKIGDRPTLGLKPLSANTIRRIEAGLRRFTAPFIDAGRTLNIATSVDGPTHTLLANGPQMALIRPQPFIDVARNNAVSTPLDGPSATVTTGRNLSLIDPPAFLVQNGHFGDTTWRGNGIATASLTAYHGGRDAVQSTEEPAWTIATNNQFGVVSPSPEPFLCNYNGNGGGAPVGEPAPTMRTTQGHCLIEPNWSALVEECGYRMLQAHEAKNLMGFRPDYILLGSQSDQFKQAGNAVTPPVAEMLAKAVVESLI